jgi:hypothetical protein
MANISGVVTQLRRERDRLSRELERLDNAIAALDHIGGRGRKSSSRNNGRTARRKLSAAARARISAAQRARWAKVKAKLAKKAA